MFLLTETTYTFKVCTIGTIACWPTQEYLLPDESNRNKAASRLVVQRTQRCGKSIAQDGQASTAGDKRNSHTRISRGDR